MIVRFGTHKYTTHESLYSQRILHIILLDDGPLLNAYPTDTSQGKYTPYSFGNDAKLNTRLQEDTYTMKCSIQCGFDEHNQAAVEDYFADLKAFFLIQQYQCCYSV